MNSQKELEQIGQIIRSGTYLNNRKTVLEFLKNEELRSYFMRRIPEKLDDLQEIEFLLEKIVKNDRPFDLFRILEGSINDNNSSFIVSFVHRHYQELEKGMEDMLFREKSLSIINKVLRDHPNTAEDTFDLIESILSTRGKAYRKFETRERYYQEKRLIGQLLEELFSIYRQQSDEKRIEEIITLIDRHFNLIGDDRKYVTYTPNNIFSIIRDFIIMDFEKNFRRITRLLINQYDQEYKRFGEKVTYKGWELTGGGISQSGNRFSIRDRNFVSCALQPALEKCWEENKDRTWEFIIEDCISGTKDKVSRDRPDFLNRSALGILIKEYACGQHKQEAFEILSDFIKMRKGIPHKSDLIYQELRGSFPDEKKWKLVKISVDKHKIPVNPFIEQIILGLAKHGDERAKKILINWIKSKDYYQKGRIFEENIVMTISQFLDDSFEKGTGMFKDLICGNYFLAKMESFDAFSIARLLNKIIKKDIETGSEILKTLSQKPELTDNEQILLCNALIDKDDSKQENEKVLMGIYETFLDPFLNDLGNDIKEIESRITRSQSREAILQFADALAKQRRIREAIRIVEVLINDSDPCTPKRRNPEDPEGKYDEHKKIEQGEDVHPITSVRGWCAWVLMNCAVLDGRDYIPENIDLTEKLTKDQNYYVKHMACLALSQLAQSRLTVLPKKRDVLFLNDHVKKALEMSKRIEGIAFDLLKDISKLPMNARKVLGKSILRVFTHMRALNQDNALKLIKTLEKFPEEAVAEAAPLFVYFAELRRNSFKDWKWKMPGLYDDLDNFDSKPFQQLLERILKKKNPKINSQFSWHFYEFVEKSVPDKLEVKNFLKYDKAFEISYEYLDVISNYYDQQAFSHIYRFIQDNFEKKPKKCYQLWRKCLVKEKMVIKKKVQEGKANEVYWWPFYDNGQILMAIKKGGVVKEFLDLFEFLLSYPKEVNIGDIGNAIEALEGLPKKHWSRVNKIFNQLVERNPNFYDAREKWKSRRKY